MDYTRLSRIEHGSRPAPGLAEIRVLADLLGLDMADLLVSAGTSREVMEHLLWSQRLQTAETASDVQDYCLVGSPLLSKNTFSVEVTERNGALCTIALGEERVIVFSFSPQDEIVIEIPPETATVHLDVPDPTASTSENVFPARVRKIRRLGQVTNLVLAGNGFELNTLHTGKKIELMRVKEGETVFVSVQATAIRTRPKKEEAR